MLRLAGLSNHILASEVRNNFIISTHGPPDTINVHYEQMLSENKSTTKLR